MNTIGWAVVWLAFAILDHPWMAVAAMAAVWGVLTMVEMVTR